MNKYTEEELKAEAVNDYKAIEKGELNFCTIYDYIKWKNNLTEEDLK